MKAPSFSPTDITTMALVMEYKCLKVPLKIAARILGRSDDYIAAYLHEHGVTIERLGNTKKLVRIADLAQLAADRHDDIAPIRND